MKISLIGNPNCGKSTLFNLLTGAKQRVGNWPGVTVEKKTGILTIGNRQYEVVDLPGTYAIENLDVSVSQDEMITREFVLNEDDHVIINIIDATNLQRSLYLTYQLLDLNRPMIVVLNMMDALRDIGESINIERLSQQLGCPVVGVSAAKKTGHEALKKVIDQMMQQPTKPAPAVQTLREADETALKQQLAELPADSTVRQLSRWQLIELILDPAQQQLTAVEESALNQFRQQIADWCDGEVDIAIASSRYDAIDQLTQQVIEKPREVSDSLSEKLDRLTLGRITGIPIFLLAMYLMFLLAVKFGSVFIDFFDGLCGTIFVDGFGHLLESVSAPDWLVVILANGIGSGIQTVATFIPVIAAMFFCLSFLEDSGYLARAAMVVDRGMRAIGLPGKAFVPMLVGFGCNVPAIMGTRTLDSARDRLMSICMIPFMSCGARLPVFALFAVIFFPHSASSVVFMLYILGIIVAIITGLILKFSLLPGKATPFIMELPAYRIPTLRGMLHLTWSRLKSFIVRAGKAIVVMVTVLSVLNSFGTDGTFGNSDSNKSVLSVASQQITPVFAPMGITENNWPATVGIFTGVFAKEAVIATLNSLYSMDASADEGELVADEPFDFWGGIKDAVATIPANLEDMANSLLDPLGLSAVDEDIDTLQDDLAVSASAVSTIQASFGSSHAALAYLIFILLYTPCVAALGAVYREAGLRWTLFVAGWTFAIAWLSAVAYYQFSLIGSAQASGIWMAAVIALFVGLISMMMLLGRNLSPQAIRIKKPAASECHNDCCM